MRSGTCPLIFSFSRAGAYSRPYAKARIVRRKFAYLDIGRTCFWIHVSKSVRCLRKDSGPRSEACYRQMSAPWHAFRFEKPISGNICVLHIADERLSGERGWLFGSAHGGLLPAPRQAAFEEANRISKSRGR